MFNSLLLDSNDSIVADRLARLQDSLRALELSTREEYQAAVYSLVNRVINLGDTMQPLEQIRPRPAVVGDLTLNLQRLNEDSTDIAAEMLRIENNAGDLYNLAAASQNSLRQLIRQMIYISNRKQVVLPFIDNSGLQPGYTSSIDFNAGVATLPLKKETQLPVSFAIGLDSRGTTDSDPSVLSDDEVGTAFQWNGTVLSLLITFPAGSIVNRIALDLDSYEGLEITSLTSSPDGQVFNDVLADLDEEAIVLDATSGKCSGDVILDFPPRIAQKMKLVISVRAGQPGFALRTLKALSRTYQSSGKLTSLPIKLSGDALQFSADQVVSDPFTTITHQISTDGVSFTSISTGLQAISGTFWYRALLSRSDSAFNQQSSALVPLVSSSAVNNPYTVVSQSTSALNSGLVEQKIVLSNVTGPVKFQDAPLKGSFRVQAGSTFLDSTSDYSLNGTVLSFSATQSRVTITYQTSALGAAALSSLRNYYSPLLYLARFQTI